MEKILVFLCTHVHKKSLDDITKDELDRVYFDTDMELEIVLLCLNAPLENLRQLIHRLEKEDVEFDTQTAGDLANILCNATARKVNGFCMQKSQHNCFDPQNHTQISTFNLFRGEDNVHAFRIREKGEYVLTYIPTPKPILPDVFQSVLSRSIKTIKRYYAQSHQEVA